MKNLPLRRRRFLNSVVLFSATASAFPALVASQSTAFSPFHPRNVPLDQLTLANFSPHLGGTFELMAHSGTIPLRLIEASALGVAGARPASIASRLPFSLIFLAPSGSALPAQTYRIRHPRMGGMKLFLVPIGTNRAGLNCEAIFN